jgi:hypothetical protein
MTQPTRQRQLAPVVLICTDCQHIFQPDLLAKLSATGCEKCGGWTWIAQTDPPELPRPRGPRVDSGADPIDHTKPSFGDPR